MSRTLHAVIDATTGKEVAAPMTDAQFDRWYDHHCFWRQPRSLEEVNPELREVLVAPDFVSHDAGGILTHYLVNAG